MLSTGVDDLRRAPTTWVYTNLLLSRLNFIRLPGDSRRWGQKSSSARQQPTTLVYSPIQSSNLGRLGNRCTRACEISFPCDDDYLSSARLKWRCPPRDATCHGSVEECSRLFSKLMASDDVPVCSRQSWPWRAGSRTGSLCLVVLVTFNNVIPMARHTSRLSDRWLLSRLWATTCHSEQRRNNNCNINLVVKIVEGSRRIPGARDNPGLSLRSENDSWVANPMYTKGTRVFITFWSRGRGHDVMTARAQAIITQACGTALTHGWVLFPAPSESLSTGPAGRATKERSCGGWPQLVPPWHICKLHRRKATWEKQMSYTKLKLSNTRVTHKPCGSHTWALRHFFTTYFANL